MVRSGKNTGVIFIATVALILVISSLGFVSTVGVAEPENDWRARPFFLARPTSLTGPDPLSPSQIIDAYNLNSSTGGAGATIAVVDPYDDPTVANDLATFSKNFSLPTANFVEKKMKFYISPNSGWAIETSLDVEWAHAIAPNATILLVEARSNSLTDLMAAVSYAASQPGVKAVSMSWGGSEFSTEASYDSYFSAAGITFFASSGDNGAGVMWPSSSPNVVGAGGTTLNLNSNGTVISETAWNGSGGGVSAYEAMPTYQKSYGLTYKRRAVPDVSYDADPATGVYVYDSTPYEGSSGWWDVGGTSAGAPQWAAIQALGLSANNVNFYQDAASPSYASYFRDITNGSNGYSAGPGYDLVTGLGSPVTTSFTLSTTPDFSLSASPATLSIGNGTSGASTITATSFNSFTGNVTLSTTAPTAWTASLSPTSISPASQSTLNVTVPSNASSGTYLVTVIGTSGSLNHTISVPVQVTTPVSSTSGPPNVYINANGSITPVGAPITTSDNMTYAFTGNISYPTYDGVVVQRSSVVIDGEGYTVQGNQSGNGLYLTNVNNVTIRNTNIEGFENGVYLDSSSNNTLSGNNVTANIDGIMLDSSSNDNTVIGNNASANSEGIYVGSSSNNTVSGNYATVNNDSGVGLYSSSSNSISGNNVTANNHEGIYLESSSNYNSIGGNSIANNHEGILLENSSWNSIIGNNIANNDFGTWLFSSSNNTIYHNNLNDTSQVFSYQSVNVWDDGFPSGGNYWSDYNGSDVCTGPYQNVSGSDGIGDTPYVIDANNTDNYPLMGPFSSFDGVSAVSNSTISNLQIQAGLYVSFDVSGPADTAGFCTLTIPYSTMPPPYVVFVDGHQTPFTTVYDNGTLSVIYLAYQDSAHLVTITPTIGGAGRMPYCD